MLMSRGTTLGPPLLRIVYAFVCHDKIRRHTARIRSSRSVVRAVSIAVQKAVTVRSNHVTCYRVNGSFLLSGRDRPDLV